MNCHESEQLGCDYCGLPLPPSRQSSAPCEADHSPQYCCYGCAFAAAVGSAGTAERNNHRMLARLGLAIFLTMNVVTFTMVLWTYDVYGTGDPEAAHLDALLSDLFRYLGLLFSLPVVWLLGWPVAANAWQNLRRGRATTDLLLIVGVAASYLYSAVSVVRGSGHVYFEVGCVVLVMVTLGRWLEATGKLRAAAVLDRLQKLLPEQVRVRAAERDEWHPLETVSEGDQLHVLAGERIPTDGRILYGQASVDEQVLTGESRPVIKEPDDRTWGGTLNLDGDLVIEVTATPAHGTLSRLIAAVTAARQAKGYYQRLADATTAWFIPLVAIVTLGTVVWHAQTVGIEQGLMAGLAVALIACPCALGLATPMAVWAAIGRASQSQVVFHSGEALERLATVRAVCFDKTGTITTGAARLLDCAGDEDASGNAARRRAASIAAHSSHVLSAAISGQIDPWDSPPGEIRTLAGRGLQATFADLAAPVFLGSLRLMQEMELQFSPSLREAADEALQAGRSLSCIGWQGRVRAVFVFDEQLRDEASKTLLDCRRAGLQAAVLTGDHKARAAALAAQLAVDVAGELLPQDKVRAIESIRAAHGPVAMVGDGINDAPALAGSDVGIALGCGADVSRESADVCLLSNDLSKVPWAIDLARDTVRVIRQNLFWSFSYNTLGIGLASTGWLNPVWAALAMVLSSLFVITNSLRLAGSVSLQSPRALDAPASVEPELEQRELVEAA